MTGWLATWMDAWATRRDGDAGAPALRLRRVLALDARRRLSLVQVGERQVLLLTGGGHDQVVGWLPDA